MSATDFQLIETLLWQPGSGYCLLDLHLSRLAASAGHFNFTHEPGSVQAALDRLAVAMPGQAQRVRLLLAADGRIEVRHAALDAAIGRHGLRYAWAKAPVDSADRFLRHKTTRRAVYDSEFAQASAATGCDEVLFVNERGEVTEGSWTTLFVEREGRLMTPPLSCGLLPGTLRRSLLDATDGAAVEHILRPADVTAADRVFLGNSVRGLMPAIPAP